MNTDAACGYLLLSPLHLDDLRLLPVDIFLPVTVRAQVKLPVDGEPVPLSPLVRCRVLHNVRLVFQLVTVVLDALWASRARWVKRARRVKDRVGKRKKGKGGEGRTYLLAL